MQKFYYNRKFVLVLLALLLTSCSPTKQKPAQTNETIPNWYLQPASIIPPNLLYGTGASYNLENAKKKALQNMNYNLQLQVQSSSTTNISSNRNNDNKVTTSASLQENINLSTKKITFTAVQTYKVEKIKKQYYILLTTSYNDLITDNRNKLEKNIPIIEDALINLNSANALQKITILSKTEQVFLASLDYLENLETFKIVYKNSAISYSYIQNKNQLLRKYKQEKIKVRNSLVLQIQGDVIWNPTKNLLKNHLQLQGYGIGNNPNAIFQISGHQEEYLLFDGKVKQSKLVVFIELWGLDNQSVASKEFSFKATSLQNHQEASRKAQIQLENQLKQKNIFQLLGL